MDISCTHENQYAWWEYDARGIPLCRVCDDCYDDKMAQFKPEVLYNSNYDTDEIIEPEEY
jgi:hypothetical protein